MPYNKIHKYSSISDYAPQSLYPFLCAPIALRDKQQLLTYFPLLVYTLFLNGKFMTTKGLMMLHFSNTIVRFQNISSYVRCLLIILKNINQNSSDSIASFLKPWGRARPSATWPVLSPFAPSTFLS